jgi:hypothetical protein
VRLSDLISLPEGPDSPLSEREEAVKRALTLAISFCKRNAQRSELQEMQQLWFRLLDSIMKPLGDLESTHGPADSDSKQDMPAAAASEGKPARRPRGRQAVYVAAVSEITMQQLGTVQAAVVRQSFTQLVSYVIENMIGFVPMQQILEKLVQDRGDSRFGDFKPIFTLMLDNYEYELNILATAGQLLKHDTHRAFSALINERKRAHRGLKFDESDSVSSAGPRAYQHRLEAYHPPAEMSRVRFSILLDSQICLFLTFTLIATASHLARH